MVSHKVQQKPKPKPKQWHFKSEVNVAVYTRGIVATPEKTGREKKTRVHNTSVKYLSFARTLAHSLIRSVSLLTERSQISDGENRAEKNYELKYTQYTCFEERFII